MSPTSGTGQENSLTGPLSAQAATMPESLRRTVSQGDDTARGGAPMVIRGKRFDPLHWILGILTALLLSAGGIIGSQANDRITALERKTEQQDVRLQALENKLATIEAIAQRTESNTKRLIEMHLK